MVVVPIFWAVYFPCYTRACTYIGEYSDCKPLVHMSAAICGGFITDVATNPLWVARTRLVSQHLHVKYRGAPAQYTGTLQCLRTVVQQEGVRGLYKGLTASFLGLSHVAVQFPLYEFLKERAVPMLRLAGAASAVRGAGGGEGGPEVHPPLAGELRLLLVRVFRFLPDACHAHLTAARTPYTAGIHAQHHPQCCWRRRAASWWRAR
jgi:hypothetical protein